MQKIDNNMRILKYISIILVVSVAALCLRRYTSSYQSFEGNIFGTYYKIKFNSGRKINKLEDKIKEKLQEVDNHMSVFVPHSEISRINRAEAGEDISLSPQMQTLMQISHDVWKQSGGWFDPAVGKLVELWGFGTEKPDHEPSAGKISQVLSYSNFGSLTFSKDFGTLRKKDSRTFLNLSAVAKGFGVDEVARLLEQNGIRDYLIEIGGEVRVSGRGPHGSWLVGITIPDPNRNFPEMRIEMTDYSVATSGNYRNYYYRNGRKYAHTISPQTGYPAENTLVSATVFYPECAWADAYATALTAMGTEKAKAFAQKQQLAVILQMDGGEVYVSPAARDLIGVSGNAD